MISVTSFAGTFH